MTSYLIRAQSAPVLRGKMKILQRLLAARGDQPGVEPVGGSVRGEPAAGQPTRKFARIAFTILQPLRSAGAALM